MNIYVVVLAPILQNTTWRTELSDLEITSMIKKNLDLKKPILIQNFMMIPNMFLELKLDKK